jgi:multidrug efflux pump subunit AcrA (membrane-fusion protein)
MVVKGINMQWLIILLSLSFSLWGQSGYKTFQIESSHISNGLRVTGRIIPIEGTLYIESARFAGRVSSMLVKEGDDVAPGRKLLSINSAECLSLYQEKKMARARHLDDMEKVVNIRESQLAMKAEENACYIIATKGGVITKKMVEAGSNFNIGDNLFTVINKHSLTVELDVPERDASRIKVGQKVKVTRSSEPGKAYDSEINAIIPSLSSVSRTVKVRLKKVDFHNNPSLDELVFAQIKLGTDDVLFKVPSSSIVFNDEKDYILKVEKDKIRKVEVTVVNQSENFFYIKEKDLHTINVGDQVVSEGAIFQMQKLK